MKKQLLISGALLLALSTYSQSVKQKSQPSGMVDVTGKEWAKYRMVNSADAENSVITGNKSSNPSSSMNNNSAASSSAASPIISVTFNRFSSSMNAFGMLVSNAKPLSYNRYLDAACFIQRKSPMYVTNPVLPANAQSGAITAYVGRNGGTAWDSTLIYSDANNWSRYPSGGIYNPLNGSNVDNAYVVGSGPVTQAVTATGWIGSWRASKKIGAVGTNSVGTDCQFFANSGGSYGSTTSPLMTKHTMPRQSFASTEDGIVRVAGTLVNDPNATTNLAYGFRGAHISKGIFTAGAMVWTSDSMVPPLIKKLGNTVTLGDTSYVASGNVYMAWNDAGNVGYVMMIGARLGSTLNNRGYQPIVYKTTNSGNAWVLVNGIDFNTGTAYDKLLNSMGGVFTATTATVTAPFFNTGEGIDVVVDNADKLHIVGTAVGTGCAGIDSLGFTYQYTLSTQPTQKYSSPMKNNAWPYIFDFSGDGGATAWDMKIIDSVGTEGPSDVSTGQGFASNPWANQGQATPVSSDTRIQVSRSYDGQFLTYSWAESDTAINTNAYKWNEFPNIHQRALRLCDGAVSTDELLISSATGFNPLVKDRAYLHYMGSTCKAGSSNLTSATFTVPYTVTNNGVQDGGIMVRNFYANAIVTHNFPSSACGNTLTTGLNALKTEASQSSVFPNPTKNSVNVTLNLSQAKDISIDVYNAIGQVISSVKANGQMGENTINVNLNNATAGVYFVKIKAGTSESTKKLIVE